jgi:hypothetical protein
MDAELGRTTGTATSTDRRGVAGRVIDAPGCHHMGRKL